MVINEKISLDQASYQTEVGKLLDAQPQVIFLETDPQTAATYLKNLVQQHGSLLPIVGTGATTDPPFIQAIEGAVGVPAIEQAFASVTRPHQHRALRGRNTTPRCWPQAAPFPSPTNGRRTHSAWQRMTV